MLSVFWVFAALCRQPLTYHKQNKKPDSLQRYSEEGEEGAGAGCGVRGAFLCTTNRGKLLQHKLIHVQCTKKGTRVPVSPVPQYGYSV